MQASRLSEKMVSWEVYLCCINMFVWERFIVYESTFVFWSRYIHGTTCIRVGCMICPFVLLIFFVSYILSSLSLNCSRKTIKKLPQHGAPPAFIERGARGRGCQCGGGRTVSFAGEFKPHIQCNIWNNISRIMHGNNYCMYRCLCEHHWTGKYFMGEAIINFHCSIQLPSLVQWIFIKVNDHKHKQLVKDRIQFLSWPKVEKLCSQGPACYMNTHPFWWDKIGPCGS